MTGGSNIRAVGPEDAQDALHHDAGEEHLAPPEEVEEDYWEEDDQAPEHRRSVLRFVWPTLATMLILGWTGFYGWANHQAILSGGSLQQWTSWITAWAVPVLLIVSAWLLIMRNSSREAERFGVIAQTLSHEAATLEERLITINRELSLAREFLGAQSRELDSLGRIATERLSEHAAELQSLVQHNGEQIDAIATVSTTALENMGKLRDDLPVLSNSAKDVSNQIGTAGMTAHRHVAELVSGFERLNQFGKASENQVDSIQSRIDVALTTFEARLAELEELTDSRFAALIEQSEAFRTDLDSREVEALAAIRRRADALSQEFSASRDALESEEEEALRSLRSRLTALREEAGTISKAVGEEEDTALVLWQERIAGLKAELVAAIDEIQTIDQRALDAANAKLGALRKEAEQVDAGISERDAKFTERLTERQVALARSQEEALSALEQQLQTIDEAVTSRRESQLAEADSIAERSEAIAARIETLTEALDTVGAKASETQDAMARRAETIGASLSQSQEAITGTDSMVAELTEACVRLLELVQASAQHSQNDLPEALGVAEARLEEVKDQALSIDGIIAQASDKSQTLSDYLVQTHETEKSMIADIDAMQARIAVANDAAGASITSLQASLLELEKHSDALSEKAQGQLREAIAALESAAKDAPATISARLADEVDSVARQLADKAGESLKKSLDDTAQASIAELESAVDRTSLLGRETTIQLRDQLAKVSELAGNLENRVTRARERAEEQVNNDFARRMALLTESLNSNAIDIAKAMSSEVTDTAWASYLKGDRGIFTRRAVRLLDNTQARDIAEIYDADDDFRENVSRYIHDFEAMLRSMLSTRDGNALGVTILSSDMGKLYVALAQAIERLRD